MFHHPDFYSCWQIVAVDIACLDAIKKKFGYFQECWLDVVAGFCRSFQKGHAVVLGEFLALFVGNFSSELKMRYSSSRSHLLATKI